jgi:two-component sensor histidine kinase
MLRRPLIIALNPFFQALIFAGIVIALIPFGSKKYVLKQSAMTTNFDQSQVVFSDLDHDRQSERIQTFLNLSGNAGIAIVDGIQTLGQWNFRGIYAPACQRIMTGDYDLNGNDEIYIFTLVGDSIMLQGLAYAKDPQLFIRDRFIARLGKTLKDPDHLFLPGKLTDMTGDGSGDLVFAITGGHSKTPRNVFIYDIRNDSLIVSPKSGAFISKMILEDIDNDSFPEILLSTYAASNYNEMPVEYSDTSSWLMALDHDLKFLFPPVEFPGPSGGIHLQMIESSQGKKDLFFEVTYDTPDLPTKKRCLVDYHGKIIKENIISPEDPEFIISPMQRPNNFPADKVLALQENKGFFQINTDLECKFIREVKFSGWGPDLIDIDLDGTDEFILLNPDHKNHLIYRSDFRHPVDMDMPMQSIPLLLSVKLNGDNPPQLSVQGDQVWKLYDYGINPVYRIRFLIWLGIYMAILGFVLLIRKLYSFQIKKRYETEKKITTLQLSSVKAQMEPHFIMNTINTIGSSIYRQKPDEAYNLLLNFSGMVRSLLLSSDKLTRSLKEEIDFVRNYLDLEKSRFNEVFDYSIKEEEGIDPEAIIPKMIIQMHVENALKHGLLPKKSHGTLEISIGKTPGYLVMTIADNGIGRNMAAKNFSQSTGKGMKIIGQLFETYNKHNKNPLKQEITDLYGGDNNPAGTQVKIFVPLDFNPEIYS